MKEIKKPSGDILVGSFFGMPSMFWLIYRLFIKGLMNVVHFHPCNPTHYHQTRLVLFTQRFSWVFDGNWRKIPRDKKLGKETVLVSISEALRFVPCCNSLVLAEKRRLNS